MERKLELKDIAGYLPYGLVGLYKRREHLQPTLITIGVSYYKNETTLSFDNELSPILRPLSDLYRPITHNRVEVIPIVELACISNPSVNWECDNCDYAYDESYVFHYNEEYKCFIEQKDNRPIVVRNQYQLFDKLHELKVDYRGLIDDGSAIDVNSLDVNPYK